MLTIEIVSDLVCPWCFIGLRRLSTAIEQVRREIPGFSCRKVWRPSPTVRKAPRNGPLNG